MAGDRRAYLAPAQPVVRRILIVNADIKKQLADLQEKLSKLS